MLVIGLAFLWLIFEINEESPGDDPGLFSCSLLTV
jgi:hypothetical protein